MEDNLKCDATAELSDGTDSNSETDNNIDKCKETEEVDEEEEEEEEEGEEEEGEEKIVNVPPDKDSNDATDK